MVFLMKVMFFNLLVSTDQISWIDKIGSNDFVATTIALNLATEYWFKLSEYLSEQVKETTKTLQKKQAEFNVLRISDDAKEHVDKQVAIVFKELHKKVDCTCI